MIALVMIVDYELCDRMPKRCLSDEDHPTQTFFLGTDLMDRVCGTLGVLVTPMARECCRV